MRIKKKWSFPFDIFAHCICEFYYLLPLKEYYTLGDKGN